MATHPHDAMRLAPGSSAIRALLYDEFVNLPKSAILPRIKDLLGCLVPDAEPFEREAVLELAQRVIEDLAGNIYHRSEHPLHVAVAVQLLLKYTTWPLGRRAALLLLIAALGHDHGWRGHERSKDYFFLERRAATATTEIMRNYGFSEDDIRDVTVLILATSPLYRREIMIVVDAVEWQCADKLGPAISLPPELTPLLQDPALAIQAGILSDADLFFSIALGEPSYMEMTRRVFEEQAFYADRPFKGVDPSKEQDFFIFVCTDNFASGAGTEFSESLERLWSRSVGTSLFIHSSDMSKRLRTRTAFERGRVRGFLFEALGGWSGYRSALRLETHGHVVFMKEDQSAVVISRGGLCMSGHVSADGLKIERVERPGFGRLA